MLRKMENRFALSFDIHPLVDGRKLYIGGVEIPFHKGALGHSDGDALLHALTDALLAAGGFQDIGSLFPDSDPKYKDQRSSLFVRKALELLEERGFQIAQIDLTLILDEPKIAPFYQEIKKNLATLLNIPIEKITLKARSTEGVLFSQKGTAIAAFALVVLEKR